MSNFYTSEILLLPKKIEFLDTAEKLSSLQKIVYDYLAQQKKFSNLQNISFFNQELINFPIEEIRRMQVEAGYSASLNGQEDRALVLLNFDSASSAAQNAALKIIEESPSQTLILILVFKIEKILETILSRCLLISLDHEKANAEVDDLETTDNFSWPKNYAQAITLAETYKDRFKALQLVENLLKTKQLNSHKKQVLLQAYQDLNHNQNTQLTLENCFFSLVHLEH